MPSKKINPPRNPQSLPQSLTGVSSAHSLHSSLHSLSAWLIFSLVTLTCISIFAVHLVGPPDLMDNDQERPASYVMDILSRGNWIVQHDQSGAIMSKPPVSTWLTAFVAIPFKNINLLLLYLPCALATLAIAWLILGSGSIHFGAKAAFFGSIAYLLSPIGYKQIALSRTDSLFAFMVFGAGLLAYSAWTRGCGSEWTWFWLMAAVATLTKGPLAVILALGGLLAVFWEKRSGNNQPLRGSHVSGIVLFFLITLGWLILAYFKIGSALTDKMIWKELFGHAVKSDKGKLPLVDFYKPFLYFLSRFAPWSILACIGFWRIVKRPAHSLIERRFERFLFCYFFFGLLIFSLAPHQRPDHLWPLIPAAALIAGRELAYLFRSQENTRLVIYVLLLLMFSLSLVFIYNKHFRSLDNEVIATSRVKEFANDIRKKTGDSFPLIYVDTPYTLQFYLNTMTPRVSPEQAAQALASDYPAFVVVKDLDHLKTLLDRNPNNGRANSFYKGGRGGFGAATSSNYYTLARWPELKNDMLSIVSNHPSLEATSRITTFSDPLMIKMEGVRLDKLRQNRLIFQALQHLSLLTEQRPPTNGIIIPSNGLITLTNQSNHAQRLRVEIDNIRPRLTEDIVLEAGQSWSRTVCAQHLVPVSGYQGKRYVLAMLIYIPLILILITGGFYTLKAISDRS